MVKSAKAIQGSCYCGQVRFEVDLPSKFCAHCHCHNCRRAHGAAFVTWMGFPKAQFRFLDNTEHIGRYQTNTEATRTFCRACGTTLLFESPRWAGEVHVVYSNLTGELDRTPSAHAFFDRHVSWFDFSDTLPKYGGPSGTERLDGG